MSSSLSNRELQMHRGFGEVLRSNREMAMKLPPTGDSFAFCETDLMKSEFHRLNEIGAIRRVEREEIDCESGHTHTRWRWKTVERAEEWVKNNFDETPECPGADCFSTGVRCLEAGERYTCTNDYCNEIFGRDTALGLIDP